MILTLRLPLALAIVLPALAQAQPADPVTPVAPAAPSRIVEMVLDEPRDEPADYVRNVVSLIDLGAASFAKPVFDELLALELDDAQRAALVERVGTAALARIAGAEELGPQRTEFVGQTLAAAAREMQSPQRLSGLLDQVTSDNPDARSIALTRLQSAGESAAVAALARMAEIQDRAKQNHLRQALVRLAPLSTPMLTAALQAPDAEVRKQAAWALGQIGDRLSLPYLAAVAAGAQAETSRAAQWAIEELTGARFSPPAVEPILQQALQNAQDGVPPRRPNNAGQVTLWLWDADAGKPTPATLPTPQASEIQAARLAVLLWRLDESDTQHWTRAALLTAHANWVFGQLGADAALEGPDLNQMPGYLLSEGLAEALEQHLAGAAIATLKVLGERGVVDVLYSADGSPAPVAAALQAPHPGVRFAALQAVMNLNPAGPFPGASRVADALVYFASSDNQRAAIVAMPRVQDAATLGGYLAAGGLVASSTNLGKEVLCQLIERPDVELVFLDMSLLRPNVREVLFQVRRRAATAQAPVALLAREGRLEDARRLARQHQGVIAVPRPHSTEAALAIVERLSDLAPLGTPDVTRRGAMAQAAADWIEQILQHGPSFYALRDRDDALLSAVTRPREVEDSIPSLAALGTPRSQETLVNIASLGVLSIETRRAAAEAFDLSVRQHGLLLTSQEILTQYDRYNASATADADTQSVLGAVLDSIESRRLSGS